MQDYTQNDRQIHLLCQIIAKANRTYVPRKADDSHTNLFFDALGTRILGRWINTAQGRIILSLNLENLHLEWVDDRQNILLSVASVGRTLSEIEQKLRSEIQKRGLEPDDFSEKLHFEITKYSFADVPVQEISQQQVREWCKWRQLANEACLSVLGYLQAEGEIRIWPHHFDTGIYTKAHEKLHIGFGWAMEDDLLHAPYFYLAGYPAEGSLIFENLPELEAGHWLTEGHFKGAVLSMDELKHLDKAMLEKKLHYFLHKSLFWFVNPR